MLIVGARLRAGVRTGTESHAFAADRPVL